MNAPLNATQLAAIRDIARSGDKIGAIKLHREYTGVGLGEAKDAVEKIEAGKSPNPLHQADMPSIIVPERAAWIQEALFKGEKIEAIKLYREGTNLGLKESKEAVEKLEAELRQKSPERFTVKASGKSCLVLLVACGGMLAVAIASVFWYRH